MKTSPVSEKPTFQKTEVPCLYRYSSNGVYYALVKHEGKQKRASLETTDKVVAKRKLGDGSIYLLTRLLTETNGRPAWAAGDTGCLPVSG